MQEVGRARRENNRHWRAGRNGAEFRRRRRCPLLTREQAGRVGHGGVVTSSHAGAPGDLQGPFDDRPSASQHDVLPPTLDRTVTTGPRVPRSSAISSLFCMLLQPGLRISARLHSALGSVPGRAQEGGAYSMARSTRLSRRAVLTWSGVVGIALVVPITEAAASAAPRGATHPHVPPRARLLTPAGQADREVPRSLGVVLDEPMPAGTDVEFTYDPDLYERLPQALVRSGDIVVPARSVTPAPGRTIVTLHVATVAPTTLMIGSLVPARYPRDIRRRARSTAIGGDVPKTELDARPSDRTTAGPWGAECGVLWEAIEWEGKYRYYVPLSASFRSVGPGPVPAGAELRVQADARVLTELSVVKAVSATGRSLRGTANSQVRHGVTALVWRGEEATLPGDRVVLMLAPSTRKPRAALAGVTLPIVEFVAPPQTASAQRESRLTSLTRHDVICDEAAVAALRPV